MSERAKQGEPSERPDRPDDIRPWMQLNHRAHPPTPDPCRLPVLIGTLQVPLHPGTQRDRPSLAPMGPSEGAGCQGTQQSRPSQRQDGDLEATLEAAHSGSPTLAHPHCHSGPPRCPGGLR